MQLLLRQARKLGKRPWKIGGPVRRHGWRRPGAAQSREVDDKCMVAEYVWMYSPTSQDNDDLVPGKNDSPQWLCKLWPGRSETTKNMPKSTFENTKIAKS